MNKAKKRAAIDLDLEIGQRVAGYRRMRGWTQPQLAAQLGVTYQQMHKYEHGINRLSAVNAMHVAAALGVRIEELLRPVNGAAPPVVHPTKTLNFVRGFEALSPTRQDAVLNLVRALAA